jgi:hypothetical protein
MTKKLLAPIAAAVVAIVSLIGDASVAPAQIDVFRSATVAPRGGGGEPSIASAPDGTLYISYPGPGMGFYRSTNLGKSWIKGATADADSGDTTVNVDSSGAVYQSNLLTFGGAPSDTLQIDIYKSLNGGAKWTQKGVTGTADNPSSNHSTNSTFLVDRQWVDVYVPPGKTTNEARVYVTYHDFVAGIMWVNVSKDGGKTFSEQQTILTDPEAIANGLCNVIPGGTRVVQSGPHAGRVYAAWLSGNAATNAPTGCNYTQMDTFGQIWSAYSDDEGATWTDQLVYDAGPTGHDASYLFSDLTLDSAGNPYLAFTLNDGDAPHLGGENDLWNIFVSASFDGGKTWNGASDGSGAPYKVTSTIGTHVFPAITAGDPGRVAVAYLATDAITPQIPYGKAFPGGVPGAKWNVFLARSLDLNSANPTWKTLQLTSKPMHTGDICNLGIFCLTPTCLDDSLPCAPGISDRSLLDFIDVVGDPAGMVHVAYTDTANSDAGTIVSVDQLAGVPLIVKGLPKPKPKLPKPRLPKPRVLDKKLSATGVGEAPLGGVLLLAGAAIILRRMRRTA